MLRGLGGVAIGLPFLEEMLVTSASAAPTANAPVPVRAFNVFFGLGIPAPLQQEGFQGVMEPLKPLADKLLIMRGVDQVRCDQSGINAHFDGASGAFTATPPDGTRHKEPSIRGGNPAVFARKGMPEIEAWARERPDGGRGFGFTGGHDHWNWAHDDFRKLVLNAIIWSAGVEVPEDGVPSRTPTLEDLEANQDFDPPEDFDRNRIKRMLAGFRAESQGK